MIGTSFRLDEWASSGLVGPLAGQTHSGGRSSEGDCGVLARACVARLPVRGRTAILGAGAWFGGAVMVIGALAR